MAVFSYNTLKFNAEGVYKEKGSRFLAFAFPVESEMEIKESIGALKKEYFDARHHCYAWMLGADKKQFRAFDDGEPNHSSGDPILGQIRSRNLTKCGGCCRALFWRSKTRGGRTDHDLQIGG